MMEIFDDKIQDLLIPIEDRPSKGLMVREHPELSNYVEDLTRHPVICF